MHTPQRWVGVLLSFAFAGVGHVYMGLWLRGALLVGGLTLFGVVGAAMLPHLGGYWWIALVFVTPSALSRVLAAIDIGGRATPAEPATTGAVILRTVLGFVVFAAFASGAAVVMRRSLLEAYKVPAASMTPTVCVGDHIMVDKTVHTFTRGDVIVFPFPEKPDQDFVKRAIGIGGDVVEVDELGLPTVNGVAATRCHVGPFDIELDGRIEKLDLHLERLDGRAYLIAIDPSFQGSRFGPFHVPNDGIFVLGDYRTASHDSRMWFSGKGGTVPNAEVRGRVSVIWLSSQHGGIDWGRIGPLSVRLPSGAEGLQPALDACLR